MASFTVMSAGDIARQILTRTFDDRYLLAATLEDVLRRQPWQLDFGQPDFAGADGQMVLPDLLGVRSSGTTGPERVFWRHRAQIEMEVDCILERLRLPFGEVYCFAPVNHIFGFVCGLLVAQRLRACFVFCPHGPDGAPLARSPKRGHRLAVTLPASWHILSRTPIALPLSVVHSAGPIPEAGRELMRRLGDALRVAEILGSAETGAVAYRDDDTAGCLPWTLMPDVTCLCPAPLLEPVALCVASPRCAPAARHLPEAMPEHHPGQNDASVATDDLIEPVDDRRFHLLGRRSKFIKVNGLNVHLDTLEAELEPTLPDGCAVVLQPVQDPVRGEGFEVFVQAAKPAWLDRAALERQIRIAISRRCGGTVRPIAFVYTNDVARTITGKIKIAQQCAHTLGRAPSVEIII